MAGKGGADVTPRRVAFVQPLPLFSPTIVSTMARKQQQRKGEREVSEDPSLLEEEEENSEMGEEDGPPSIDPYEVLGLATDATADDVKRAYRKLALKHHPGALFLLLFVPYHMY